MLPVCCLEIFEDLDEVTISFRCYVGQFGRFEALGVLLILMYLVGCLFLTHLKRKHWLQSCEDCGLIVY